MKKILILTLITVLLYSCSKGGSDDGPSFPEVVNLVFPDNNQECNEGISVNATQSQVTFQWNASANTTTYDLVIKNLDTDATTTINSVTTEATVTINKATPYSWHVVSKSDETPETAQSATWKFYNAGDAIQNYAPFPAELVAPTMGANLTGITSVTLEWSGSDVDNDIIGYDVYFDTVTPPSTQVSTDQTEKTNDVSVSAGNIYYWKVITKDAEGNNSESPIFEFRVD
jgi:hypothetical protein